MSVETSAVTRNDDDPSDVTWLTGTEVLDLFNRKELSPSEYLERLFSRIEADASHEKPLNAFVEVLFDEARAQAVHADQLYAGGGSAEERPPLLGLPIAAKESHSLAGRSSSRGIASDAGVKAPTNHVLVDRLQRAGGIFHARTTTPQLSCVPVTHSKMWGVSRTAWDRDKSPGGSSGGSGAALSGGLTPVATASDIGGSTRIPSSFSGAVGYKGPYGVVPGAGTIAADWYRSDGAMARSVTDVALLMNIMRGVHRSDHASVPSNPVSVPSPGQVVENLRGKKIVYCPTLGNYPVETGVRAQLDAAASALSQAGAEVEEIELPWDAHEIWRITMAHTGHMFGQGMRKALEGKESDAEDYTRRNIEDGIRLASEMTLFEVLEAEQRVQAQLGEALEGASAMITPVSGVRAIDANGSYLDGITVTNQPDGRQRHVHRLMQAIMTKPFNITNRCPILVVPAGFDDGFPIGMQIVGNAYDEQSVFDIGAAYEQLSPWIQRRPSDR